MRVCPRHNRVMVIRSLRGWKYFECPQEGCYYIRAFKWQRTPKRQIRMDFPALGPAKASR